MDTTCLQNLVGLKTLCSAGTVPNFYLDDIQGIDQEVLAKLAKATQGSGKKMAEDIIDSSVRLLLADIESAIPANFILTKELVSICSSCSTSGFYSSASGNGTNALTKLS